MTLETTIRIWREGAQYVAHAMPIDVSSAGPTPQAGRAAVREAVELFIATAREHGTMQEVLEECGYVANGDRYNAPAIIEHQQDLLAV